MKLLLSLLLFGVVFCSQAESLKFVAIDYPPYYGAQLKNNGPFVEIVQRAYAKTNYDVEVLFVPWQRAIEWSKQGKVDGIIGAWHTKEREQFLLYSEALYPNSMVLYKQAGSSISFSSFKELGAQGLILGSVRGYLQLEKIESSGLKINYVNNDIQNFKLLKKGRVQLVLVDKYYAKHMLKQPELKDIANHIEPMNHTVEHKQQFITISKQTSNPMRKVKLFNQGLKALKDSGEFNQILFEYGFAPLR